MNASWTLSELVAEVATRIAALPEPKNGQVRAVPDERTVRYYGTIGLLDRPLAMRGRTALYGRRHLAQVVAIKRLQQAGRSLAEIQAMWPMEDVALARMSGVQFTPRGMGPARREFWKRAPVGAPAPAARSAEMTAEMMAAPAAAPAEMPAEMMASRATAPAAPDAAPAEMMASRATAPVTAPAPVELRIELAPHITLSIAMPDDIALSSADVRALRAAAAPLVTELARRRLTVNAGGES